MSEYINTQKRQGKSLATTWSKEDSDHFEEEDYHSSYLALNSTSQKKVD